jgi:RNA-directed DNA polymerase
MSSTDARPRAGKEQLSTGLRRIREAARKDKNVRFSALLHHVTVDLLEASYRKLNPKASPGVDGVTWDDYGKGLEGKLKDLHARIHRGAYRAQPARRTYIPKEGAEMRPLGIAALEDKIVQQSVVWTLEQIYEEDFLGFSYGFRPGRSPHKALDALYMGIKTQKVNWILDVDIRRFFDTIDHKWIISFMEHRIADRRILRLIRKWLKAGVSEEGRWSETTVGTPQGAVISPLLANIYLHYVLDLWAQHWRKNHAHGDMIMVRYADDVVFGFQRQSDAAKFRCEFAERLAKFGLSLNKRKTRLIEFGRYAAERRSGRGQGKPETFEFLGFTHISGKSRNNGRFLLKRKTSSRRLRKKIREIRGQLLWHRHKAIPEHGAWLKQVLQGYFNYHAIPGNTRALKAMRRETARAWQRALRRRSQKGRSFNWEQMKQLMETWLPPVTVIYPYPDVRFRVTTQGRSRMS